MNCKFILLHLVNLKDKIFKGVQVKVKLLQKVQYYGPINHGFVLEQRCTKINPHREAACGVDVLGSALKALRELSGIISASSNFQGLLCYNTPFN